MGTTMQNTGGALGSGTWTYLTIEYKKEEEMKYIVVRVRSDYEVSHLIKYFDQIKGTGEMNKQEL